MIYLPGLRRHDGRRPRRSLGAWLVPALLGSAALVTMAGCGSGSSGSATAGSAPSHTASGAPSGSQGVPQALTAVAQASRHITSLTATVTVHSSGAASENIAGTVAEQLKPSLAMTMQIRTSGAGQQTAVSMILIRTAIYLKASSLSGQLGKPWLKIPLSSVKSGKSSFGQLVQQLTRSNPVSQEQLFTGAKDVHVVGSEVIGGVSTTHYAGSYQPSAALAALPAKLRKQLAPSLTTVQGRVKFDIWIDAQHQIRRFTQTEQVSGNTTTTSVMVTSINQPVRVSLPPASQVAVLPGGLGGY